MGRCLCRIGGGSRRRQALDDGGGLVPGKRQSERRIGSEDIQTAGQLPENIHKAERRMPRAVTVLSH